MMVTCKSCGSSVTHSYLACPLCRAEVELSSEERSRLVAELTHNGLQEGDSRDAVLATLVNEVGASEEQASESIAAWYAKRRAKHWGWIVGSVVLVVTTVLTFVIGAVADAQWKFMVMPAIAAIALGGIYRKKTGIDFFERRPLWDLFAGKDARKS